MYQLAGIIFFGILSTCVTNRMRVVKNTVKIDLLPNNLEAIVERMQLNYAYTDYMGIVSGFYVFRIKITFKSKILSSLHYSLFFILL